MGWIIMVLTPVLCQKDCFGVPEPMIDFFGSEKHKLVLAGSIFMCLYVIRERELTSAVFVILFSLQTQT